MPIPQPRYDAGRALKGAMNLGQRQHLVGDRPDLAAFDEVIARIYQKGVIGSVSIIDDIVMSWTGRNSGAESRLDRTPSVSPSWRRSSWLLGGTSSARARGTI